jgi:hypothetical protein
MNAKAPARIVIRAVVLLAVTVVVGYASAAVSRRAVESTAAAHLATQLGTRDVFVLPDAPAGPGLYPQSAAPLRRNGFSVRECPTTGAAQWCFPWAGLRVSVAGPFLLDVEWGADSGGLSGSGVHAQFLAFFGVVFQLRELGGWAS